MPPFKTGTKCELVFEECVGLQTLAIEGFLGLVHLSFFSSRNVAYGSICSGF